MPEDDDGEDRMEIDGFDGGVRDHEISDEERGMSEDSMEGLYI